MRAPDVNTPAAPSPLDLLCRQTGEITRAVWKKLDDDSLSLIAAGVAFYAFLAIFPAVAAIVSALAAIVVVGGLPAILERVGLSDPLLTVMLLVRWPVFAALVFAALVAVYRYGPSRARAVNARDSDDGAPSRAGSDDGAPS